MIFIKIKIKKLLKNKINIKKGIIHQEIIFNAIVYRNRTLNQNSIFLHI